ncbi:MAG: penicillin-binding transpeptidase domain-containing protein [Actinobacteria bacterium]|nr:penicillin-binding transpeptidase domain-containing protein [Actinomycetota bacterium]
MADRPERSRLAVLGSVSLILIGLLTVRLWFLQTVDAQGIQERIREVRSRTVKLTPERGRITDVRGRIVADNQRILTITIDRLVIARDLPRQQMWDRLSGVLNMTVQDLEDHFQSKRYDPLQPVPLKEDVAEDVGIFLRERSEDFPGVDVREDWRREYPYAPMASHIIGFLGAIKENEVSMYKNLGYDPNARVGQFGVEQTYEGALRGIPGFVKYEVDSLGNVLRELDRKEPVPGNDVQLSIDLDIQQFTEQALQTEISVRRRTEAATVMLDGVPDPKYPAVTYYKAPAGSAVVLNHDTGAVVAMASYPNFDNRWFNSGISAEKFGQIFPVTDDPDQSILVNRAISGRYNLGSSFKPFVAYAALHSGQLARGTKYYLKDDGYYQLTSIPKERCQLNVKCIFKNATCGNGAPCRYGRVNVVDALAVSSDVFFYKIGEEIFSERGNRPVLEEEVRQFGFGAPTEIDLPYEFVGTVPGKDLKKRLAAAGAITADEGRSYYVGDNVQFAIGQGLMSATPLQMAVAYSALANGGLVLRPKVVRAIWTPGTPTTKSGRLNFAAGVLSKDLSDAVVTRDMNMPAEIRDPIVEGLTRVINGPGVRSDIYHSTTGERLFKSYPKNALPIAGKTGTAQGFGNLPWNDSSAFGAFSKNPEKPYTVYAYLEKSGFGSRAAAPVVKCIFTALAERTRVDPAVPADPLDRSSVAPATSQSLTNPLCLVGSGSTVRD